MSSETKLNDFGDFPDFNAEHRYWNLIRLSTRLRTARDNIELKQKHLNKYQYPL